MLLKEYWNQSTMLWHRAPCCRDYMIWPQNPKNKKNTCEIEEGHQSAIDFNKGKLQSKRTQGE